MLRLVPAAPHTGAPVDVPLDGATFWIGASPDAGLPLFLPGVATRHAAVMARADGPWLLPQRSAGTLVRRNDAPLTEGVLLAHGDVVEFAPGVRYRVDRGERSPTPLRTMPVPRPAPPPLAPPPPRRRGLGRALRNAWQRFRRRPRRRGAWLGWTLGALALVLVAAGGVLLVRAVRSRGADVPPPLSEAEAQAYDALVARAADQTERGAALLEIGLPDAALREFGGAVTTLESSPLRDNPWVRPRIDALEAGIANIYREQRLAVPARYAAATARAARASRAGAPVLARTARLSVEDFATRMAGVQREFAGRFGRELAVTGRDHAEHLALYGAGGAVDLRVRDLTPEQVAFTVAELRRAGVRVKDFSSDAVLRAQVAAARAAGLGDRAGTGLHLHADRFLDRTDRWTVQ